MPIWLRRFHIQKISKYNEDQNKKIDEAKKGSKPANVQGPNVCKPQNFNIKPNSTYNFKK